MKTTGKITQEFFPAPEPEIFGEWIGDTCEFSFHAWLAFGKPALNYYAVKAAMIPMGKICAD
jgi:hypothetical protein